MTNQIVIAIAGVMCRGAGGGMHPGWSLLYKNIILPLRKEGKHVFVCGFNNIPETIDNCTTPIDGGRSYFRLHHYECWRQSDIDACEAGRMYRELVESKKLRHPIHERENLARVLFVEGRAIQYIREQIQKKIFSSDIRVVLVTPDLCLFGGELHQSVINCPPGALTVLARKPAKPGEENWVENGFITGSAKDIFSWRKELLRANVPCSDIGNGCYEMWWHESLIPFTVHGARLHAETSGSKWWSMHNTGRTFRGYSSPKDYISSDKFPWKSHKEKNRIQEFLKHHKEFVIELAYATKLAATLPRK